MKTKLLLLTLPFLFVWEGSAQQTPFTEVSDAVGLTYRYPGTIFQMAGGGLLVIDINNDGWEDIFQSGGVFQSKLWLNQKGVFKDVTSEYGLDCIDGYHIQGAVRADLNNDGYQDIILLNYGIGMGRGDKKPPLILKNCGGKSFSPVDIEHVAGIGNYTAATVGDINHDGLTDIYLTNYIASMGDEFDDEGDEIGYDPLCYPNKLLINKGNFLFEEAAERYGINDIGCGFAASFSDIDGDGHVDLLLLNDFGEWTNLGNRYFRNDYPNEHFMDHSDQIGFNEKMYGMGIGIGDFDEDGDLDYYITNIGRNYLYRNDLGTFSEIGREMGLDNTYSKDSVFGTSWSGLFFDFDFDGDLDLFISKGNVLAFVPKTVIRDPNQFFLNDNGTYINISQESGLNDPLSHRGSVYVDFDHDGDLDLISSSLKLPLAAFKNKDQKIKLYQNNTSAGNYIGIQLIGENGINRDCYGCRVRFEHSHRQMLHEVDNGRGHASQSTAIIYYGLHRSKRLSLVTILWEDGTTHTFKKLKANRIYEIRSGGSIQQLKRK